LEDVFPIVVLEAMAHGLPVVVSPAPFCLSSNLLTSDVNAVVLKDPHDAQALAYQILRLRNDDSLASNLVKHASIFVQNYSWETLVQSQLNMYRKLLG
jgi:UDP-glucose:(heptosyl)LPS alpha-1,3-glucosyltransferase